MDFTFDLATNQLIPTNGVDEITLKWRSREPVRIHFHRDGTDELLPTGFGLALYLKRSTTMLATCTSFTAPGTAAGYYTGTLILNTTPLTTAFTTATVLSIAAKVEAHWWASGESASPSISDSVVSAQIVRPVVAPEPSSVETVTLGYEGTDIKSTGETGGAKYLREDGDGTCSWQSPSGSGDALVANNLDQFASVTQTAGQTLAITSSTTLAGGTHSGTNTGDQSLAAYLTSATASSTYQPLDADLTSIAGLTKAGNTLKVIRVNAGETDYELATVTSGSGDALVANTLDQFANVTQTAGQTLAITSSTTLSGGTHSGTNTGDQSLAAYATLAAPVFTGQIGTDGDIVGQSAGAVRYTDGQVKFSGGANSSPFHGGVGGTLLTYGADADGQHGGNGGNLAMYGTPGQNAGSVSTIAGGSLTMGTANIAGGNIAGTILTTAGSAASLTDFPTLNQNTTGSAATLTTARTINGTSFNGSANITVTAAGSTLSDTVPTTKGGTGLTTIGTALQILRTNAGATALEFATLAGGGNAQTADPLSQFAATTSAQLAGVMSDETGSGALVFATSPTLVTPALGTPSSGNLASCTFPTLNQNTSGYAEALKSATTTVSVSAATAPTSGQVLTATSGTAATWQTPSGGGGLTNITETLVTSAPNATVNAERLEVTGGTTNTDLVLVPKGTGALILGPAPDSTGTGGNKRGQYAVDLQISKSATAARVASGNYSFLAGLGGSSTADATTSIGQGNLVTANYAVGLGYGNSASGTAAISLGYSNANSGTVSVALGQSNTTSNNRSYAIGNSNTASGDASGAMGDTCTASAKSALATGLQALASRYGQRSHAAGQFAAAGDAQAVKFVLRCKTTTNAAVEMMLDGSATRLTIISGKVLSGIVQILGMKSDGTVAATYLRQVAIKNVAGTTSLIGTVNTLGTDETGATSLSITANDTNDAIDISPTGIAAQTWRWIATFDGVEIAYGA